MEFVLSIFFCFIGVVNDKDQAWITIQKYTFLIIKLKW